MATSQKPTAFDITTCARPNILQLLPYRCARDDYKDDGTNILLDANENAYGSGLTLTDDGKLANGDKLHAGASNAGVELDLRGLHRYPDPHQIELKQLLCNLRNDPSSSSASTPKLTPAHLFLGVGSDEAIDNLLRAFCRPGHDKILTCPPTYGMYGVSAAVNDVAIVTVPLDAEADFSVRADAICAALDDDVANLSSQGRIKMVYLCSPGNPTGTLVARSALERILRHPTWNGLVVVDEAYIDFADDGSSFAPLVPRHENLVVMQTLSKAFGLAAIRLGAAFAGPAVAALLNNLKAPYNVSALTSQVATRALEDGHLRGMRENRRKLLQQRARLVRELPTVNGVGRFRGGFDANFLLVEMLDRPDGKGRASNETALKVYEGLAERKGVVVRFRGKEHGCEGCLRVTVGTEEEVDRFLKELKSVLDGVFGAKLANGDEKEEVRERQANNVVP